MRLLHARSLKFQDFNESSLPPYAILSHTWDAPEEVTLQDMTSPYLPSKKGYAKITESCRLALSQGLEYTWIDTCCIDKTSSAELTESINSMFRWYQKASVCYVYLFDLHTTSAGPELASCVWFTRGWTLQELLAPSKIEFYNSSWTLIGTKTVLEKDLSTITRIPVPAISGGRSLMRFSTAQRMSWASKRVTTREEDVAYSLLGLFDVQMPLIYGEGSKAFLRLQEEIIKRTVDLTLFAWQPGYNTRGRRYCSVLATSPADFGQCDKIGPFHGEISVYSDDKECSMTNMGLKMTASLIPQSPTSKDWNGPLGSRYILPIGVVESTPYSFGILLLKAGPRVFIRLASPGLVEDDVGDWWRHSGAAVTHSFHILAAVDPDSELTVREIAPRGIHIPLSDKIQLRGDYSLSYWDRTTRFHYFPRLPYCATAFSFVAPVSGQRLSFGVIFEFRGFQKIPECRVIDKNTYYSRLFFLILMRNGGEPMSYDIIEQELPEILQLTDQLIMESGGMSFKIAARVLRPTELRLRGDVPHFRMPQLDITVSPLQTPTATAVHQSDMVH